MPCIPMTPYLFVSYCWQVAPLQAFSLLITLVAYNASIYRQQNWAKWWVGFCLVSVFVHTTVLSDSCFNHCSLSIGLLFQTEFKGQHSDCCCFSLMIPLLYSGYGWLIVALLTAPNAPILPDTPKNLPGIPPELKQKRQAMINLARICFE